MIVHVLAAIALQTSPDLLQVSEQASPLHPAAPPEVRRAEFRARNVSTQALGFQIRVSSAPALSGGLLNPDMWLSSAVYINNRTTMNPDRTIVNPALTSNWRTTGTFPWFDLRFPPAPANTGATCQEILYGFNGTSQLLSWNTTYYWQIRFFRDISVAGNPTAWSTGAASFRLVPPTALTHANGNGAPAGLSWRFIGVPIAPGTTIPASELFDDVAFLWKLDEAARNWIPMGPGDVLEGGRGYLTWAADNITLDISQGSMAHGTHLWSTDGRPGTTASIQFTTLAAPTGLETATNEFRGNNLICNPYPVAIDWDWIAVGFPGGTPIPRPGDVMTWGPNTVSSSYWKWNGTQYVVYNGLSQSGSAGSIIQPYQAFGIVVLQPAAAIMLREPPPQITGGVPARTRANSRSLTGSPSPSEWGLVVEARSGPAVDTENVAGVHLDADDAWDARDTEEPGTLASPYVLLSFDRTSWTVNPRLYTHDVRRAPVDAGQEAVWTFTVDGDTGQPATLSWPNFSALSTADWRVTLEVPSTGQVVDLSTAASFDTPAVTGRQSYLLRARRLTDLTGTLSITAASTTPPASTVPAETKGVTMLEVELTSALEAVIVTDFSVQHAGSGDPSHVQAFLYRGDEPIAGPATFTSGVATWAGLSERIDPHLPQVWRVVYDFGAGAAGTYRSDVQTASAVAAGASSARNVSASGGLVSGSAMTVEGAAVGGGSGGGCGLLGIEGILILSMLLGRKR